MYTLAVGFALSIAEMYHGNQLRRQREPYIEHLKRVAVNAGKSGEVFSVVALLHDILEDTKMTESELREMFSAEVVDAVVLLTREEGLSKQTYMERLLGSENVIAIVVKLHDALDNAVMTREDEFFTRTALSENPESAKARYCTIAYRCRMKLKQMGYKTYI